MTSTTADVVICGWFLSLIPALLLRQTAASRAPSPTGGLRGLFANVKHPTRIWQLTMPEVFIGFGAGFIIPLLNVFFKQGLGSPEIEIGATFAAGQAVLVVSAFLAPFVAARFGKVNAVVYTRLLSIPFVLFLAFSDQIGETISTMSS